MADVLILGGGLAGTSAALALADRGIHSTIIEARGRLGGRAFSRPLPGEDGPAVEYGGSWGAARHHRLQALAARLGIGLVPRTPLVGWTHVWGGRAQATPCAPEDLAAHQAAMASWQADAAAADPTVLGMPLTKWFAFREIPPSARAEILSWWSISGANDPELGAVGQLMSPKIAKGFGPKLDELAYTIAGGVQTLAIGAARESGAEVLLSDPAERLGQDETGVTLRLASGREHRAKAAIVALPVNALEQVRFAPPLPETPAFIRRKGHLGRVVKYLIRAEGVIPGSLVTGEALGVRFFWADHLRPDGSTLVVGFALEIDLPEPSEAHARAALAMACPGARFLSADWHDWQADPFARGVWAGPRAEDEDLFQAQHWPSFGRIAFATSDIAPEEQGWFEGALASSEAAVAAIAGML